MRRHTLSYRTAIILSLGISLLLNLLFIIMFFYGRDAVVPPDGVQQHRPVFQWDTWRLFVGFANNFILAFLLYTLNFRLLRTELKPPLKVGLIIGLSIIATFALSYLLSTLQFHLLDFGPRLGKMIRGGMIRDFFVAIIVVFSSEVLYLYARKQQMALEYETLMVENVKTRYEALKNQVDPHFLFNSLNTLNSIIKVDPERAQEYVQKLSHVFRYTLRNMETITLKDELEFTGAYCSLMQIRYGDSLKFRFDTDPKYDSYLIIPLSVQGLVENAIKHNVISNRHPLTVSITTSGDDTLTISNPLQVKKEAEAGSGIGLANIAGRYRLMWQREIDVVKSDDTFSVTVPLIKPTV